MAWELGRRPRTEAGFSLVEVLVAMLLLALITLSIVPLFGRAIADNAAGKEAGSQAALGRSQLEEQVQLPFSHRRLEVEAGTARVEERFYAGGSRELGDEAWENSRPADGVTFWRRTATVRQYGVNGVQDTDGDGVIDLVQGLEDADRDGVFDNPLPAGALPGTVHLKELDVTLDSERQEGNAIHPTRPLRLKALKAF